MPLLQKRTVKVFVLLLGQRYVWHERFESLVDHMLLLSEVLIQEQVLLIQALVHQNGLGAEHLCRVCEEAKHYQHVLVILVYL